MINLLIYSGLGCLLLGSILGLIAAIKGFALNNYKNRINNKTESINQKRNCKSTLNQPCCSSLLEPYY